MATTNEYLKSLMSVIPDIDKANPFEVQRGLDYELVKMGGEVTNETVKKALVKAVKNVLSDANYYTHLLEDATYEMLGVKKPNRKKEVASTEMEEVKKKDNMAPNQMTKAKVVKESLEEKRKNPSDFVIMDVPLFIRMLEYAREDATSDMDLHDVAEKLIKLSATGKPVTMKFYNSIVSKKEPVKAKPEPKKVEPKTDEPKTGEKLNEKKKLKMPDFPDVDGDGDREEPIVKATKDKKKALKESIREDIDLGHEDDEPDMLKASVYRIAKYAVELYKMLDKYDQMEDEVDFPDWWQEKIHLAKDYLVKAKHYLDFEEKQPSLDAMVSMNEAIDGTKKYQQSTPDIKTFDTEEVILKKIYGDNLKNLEKYSVGSYTGDLETGDLGDDMKGAFFMFAPSGNNFKVYKSSDDFKEYIKKAKNVPASELSPIQQEFMKKAIDTVFHRMPKMTKQPTSLKEIELTKENVELIKKTIKKMMEGAVEFTVSGKSSYVKSQEASAYEKELQRQGVKYTKRTVQ